MVEEQVLTHTQELTQADFRVGVVRDLGGLIDLAPEWDSLVERCGVDHVFLTSIWFRTWWEAFGADNELYVINVRSRGELVAVAPMMRTRASIYGVKLEAIHAIYNPHTPRYDFVVDTHPYPELYRLIWDYLVEYGGCDVIVQIGRAHV